MFSICSRVSALLRKITLPLAAGLILVTSSAHAQLQYVGVLGSPGYGKGQFDRIGDVCVDSKDDVYLIDMGGRRIQKFDRAGNFLFAFEGQWEDFIPSGIAVDGSGNIYVIEYGNHRVDKFDREGNLIRRFEVQAAKDRFPAYVSRITVDSSGNLFVLDYNHYTIQKFDGEGHFLKTIPIPGVQVIPGSREGVPTDIAIDGRGVLYVLTYPGKIKLFDTNGKYLGQLGNSSGVLNEPAGLTVSRSGDVYVVGRNGRITRFNHRGTVIEELRPPYKFPSGNFELQEIAITSTNRLYVTNDTMYLPSNMVLVLGVIPGPISPAMQIIQPDAARAGSGDTTIHVTGADFTPTSVVRYGSTALATTYISMYELSAILPANLQQTPGAEQITVYQPENGTRSNGIYFTVTGEQLVLDEIAFNGVPVGSWSDRVILKGDNFLPGMQVRLAGESFSPEYLSPNRLRFAVPTKYRQKAATYPIRIQNPTTTPPLIGSSNARELQVISPTPVVQLLSQNTVFEQSGDTPLLITGKGFTTLSLVKLGGKTLKLGAYWSTDPGGKLDTLFVLVPAALLKEPGDIPVAVINPAPGGISNSIPFHILGGVTTLEPVSSPVPTVTRVGTNLVIKVTVKNTGEYPARNVVVHGLLNGTASTAASPEAFRLEKGTAKVVTLVFPASAAARGTTPQITVTYTSSNAGSGSQTITTAPVP